MKAIETGTEAGEGFSKNLYMKNSPGYLTAEELKDRPKQDKSKGK